MVHLRIRLILLLCMAPLAAAAAQRVSGTVRSSITRAPLEGAQVTVFDSAGKELGVSRTGADGRYEIAGSAIRRIEARRIGYSAFLAAFAPPARDTTIDITLVETPVSLDTARTISRGRQYDVPRLQDFEKRRLSGMGGRFISEDDLRKNENTSMPSILRSYVPGLRIHSYRGGQYAASSSAPTMSANQSLGPRGPTGCWVAVYVDGLMVFDRLDSGVTTSVSMPPDVNNFFALNLSGVEFYGSASSMPLQFKSLRNNCGALLFWTRGK